MGWAAEGHEAQGNDGGGAWKQRLLDTHCVVSVWPPESLAATLSLLPQQLTTRHNQPFHPSSSLLQNHHFRAWYEPIQLSITPHPAQAS